MDSKLTIIPRGGDRLFSFIVNKATGEVLTCVKYVSPEQSNVHYAVDLDSPWRVFISEDAAMAAAIKEAKLMIDVERN